MPRENLENQNEETRGVSERGFEAGGDIELTVEDKEKIDFYLHWGNTDTLSSESLRVVYEKLRQYGRKAAVYILEKLDKEVYEAEGPGQDFPPVNIENLYYRYIKWLPYCATPAESKKLGEILVREAVGLDPNDRSSKIAVMAILQQVGTEEAAEYLKIFSDRSFSINYGEGSRRFISYDNRDISTTLSLILARTPEDKKHIVEEAIAHVDENIRNHPAPRAERELSSLRDSENRFSYIRSNIQEEFLQEAIPQARERRFGDINEVRSFFRLHESEKPDIKNDEEEDEEITEAYLEKRLREAEERLQIVKNLRHEIKKEKEIKEEPEEDDTKFLRRHYLEYREKKPSPLAPTLGIEIEIREATVLPERLHMKHEPAYNIPEWNRWDNEREEKKTKYRKTEKLGVPYGMDKFWEFAHKPVRHYFTLSREVQALIEMGLIDKTDQKHPLHLTIGGVTSSKEQGGSEAFLLARTLEASAWSVRGRRLLRPFYAKMRIWSCKGEAGVMNRLPDELELEKRGIEIRTFQLQSLAGLDRLLRSAYLLGAALKAYQEENFIYGKNKKDKPERQKLAEIWVDFSKASEDLFKKFGLYDPKSIWKVPSQFDGEVKGWFWVLARLIDEAEADPKSRGAEFVKEIRKLIIGTRGKIAKIIYPETIR